MKIFSNQNFLLFVVLVIISGLVFVGCKKKDTECKAIITVKKLTDTMQTVSFADIVIAPNYQHVRVDGKADASGRFSCAFKYEGVLDVLASKPIDAVDTLKGKAVIRLVPGETVAKTVYVN